MCGRTIFESIPSCGRVVFFDECRTLQTPHKTDKAATDRLIVSHDFDMVKATVPSGKKTMAPKKKQRTINLSNIKDFSYVSPVNIVKHGFMTFDMVNICVQKKFTKFAKFAKIAKLSCMPKFTVLR